jgi:hypothetical protein
MTLSTIASALSLCASLSGADISPTSLPPINLEANQIGIEQCGTTQLEAKQNGTLQNVAFTSTMDKSDILKEVAVNKSIESREFAFLPQVERGTENVAFTYSMDKDSKQVDGLHERVAGKLPPESSIAVQPQADSNAITTLAVYQDQSKEAPALDFSVRTPEQVAVSIEWANDTHAFTSERPSERTGRTEYLA